MTDENPSESPFLSAADREIVRRVPLFAGLPPGMLERLLEPARVENLARGTLLFAQETPATHFYVILVGWVKVYRATADGGENVVHVFTRGDSFAEAAIFAGGRYPVSASTASATRLLSIPAGPFLRLLEQEPAVARNMLAAMSQHLRQLVGRLEQLQSHSAPARLAGFLLSLTDEDEGAAELRLPIDKGLLAARLGMQPETLSRALGRMRDVGIEVRGEHIRVPDVARLRELARN
jgi:CRP-like cAMP-binding protein